MGTQSAAQCAPVQHPRRLRRPFGGNAADPLPGRLQRGAVLPLHRRDRIARDDGRDLRLGCRGDPALGVDPDFDCSLQYFGAVTSPLRFARKAIFYFNTSGNNYLWFVAWYEILSTGCVLVLVCWLAYTHVPQVHDFFQPLRSERHHDVEQHRRVLPPHGEARRAGIRCAAPRRRTAADHPRAPS